MSFSLIIGGFLMTANALATGKVTLYSSNKQEAIDLVVELFKAKHPDIAVSVMRVGTGTSMKRMAAEKNKPLAGIFWSGDFGTLGAYKEYFQPYDSADAKQIPGTFVGPEGVVLIKNAPHPKEGKLLYDFLISKEA